MHAIELGLGQVAVDYDDFEFYIKAFFTANGACQRLSSA